jgi:glycosyltransferase involved in cell wall biosynthesis
VRILIFHGYLLSGTGSNIYNARLARALVGLGHEVHLLCQDRHPERQPFVDAAGAWERGELCVRTLREPVRCTAYRPEIGGLLPVYVEDPYEGIEARAFARCSEAEIERYLDANVAAVRELVERVQPDVALANHLVMGPAILARALAHRVPYAVKVHGSALEYTVKPDPERFLPYAREGLGPAAAILVGSLHTAGSLWDALEDPAIEARTRLGPPGVDVELFKPLPQRAAAGRPPEPVVAFVGKLIVNKGVDLLIAAWPLVLEQVPQARLEIVGFGGDGEWLERLLDTLAAGEVGQAIEMARAGRARGSPESRAGRARGSAESQTGRAPGSADAQAGDRAQPTPLRHLAAFLGDLRDQRRERYLAAARTLPERARFAGRLEHEELAELLPTCEALVVPSTFPEAFGMVAAEGAACGALPVSAAHSGLAEVSEVLARAVPPQVTQWLSFPVDDSAVPALAECLIGWLQADTALREQTRAALVATACARWSWEGVARGVFAAARGELEQLPPP